MKKEKSEDTTGPKSSMDSGSAKLLSKLQTIFDIYSDDLQKFIDGKTNFKLLDNTDMFDVVVKLLNVSDKIKKLDIVDADENEGEKPEPKIKNIQDFTLKNRI